MSLTKVSFSMITGASYNVLDYGATGNGTTDDRAAINLAFATCIAAGSGTVFFPKGTYYVSDFIGNTDYSGVTQEVNLAVIGDPDTVINCNPSVYGNSALYLRFQNAKTLIVKNLQVECNTKVASGIVLTSVAYTLFAQVDNCIVNNCHAVNNAGVTTAVQAISISSTAFGYNASVTNCIINNVTRAKTGLACQALVVVGFQATLIESNSVQGVKHSGTVGDKTDADGIVIFSYQNGSGNYEKSVLTVINNTIRQCEGRFVKLQSNGSATVENNLMTNAGSIELIDSFRCVDSQVGDATVQNNTIRIGTGWSGGASSLVFEMQPPLLANQDYSNEGFFQRVIGNNVEIQQTLKYFCVPPMPPAGVTANYYLDISNNICNYPVALDSTNQNAVACNDFIYLSNGPSVADTNGQVIWNIRGNIVSTYNFIRLEYTQANYTNKWWFYVCDNFKAATGYTREIFAAGATSPYTNTCMIRDNMIGQLTGTMTWPLDLSKMLEGCDFSSGGQTMTNVPPAYSYSRIYKKGSMWGVQRSNQYYISGDATTWTAMV